MTNKTDIRYKQRFQNFSKAFNLLHSSLEDRYVENIPEIELVGIVHMFEFTFELGWKLLKDYLEYQGIVFATPYPRTVIKECTNLNFFNIAQMKAEIYLKMLDSRNILSHVYDKEKFIEIVLQIKNEYIIELEKQYNFFKDKDFSEYE